jgi:hypothetical protein
VRGGEKVIDTFFCTAAKDHLRSDIANACKTRWEQAYGYRFLKIIRPSGFISAGAFQLGHRIRQEREAKTTIYCHADDDCMPLGNNFLERAIEIMNVRPEYGIIAFNDHYMWQKEWGRGAYLPDPFVFSAHSVGGIYLIRKSIVEFPDSHNWFDDTQMCKAIVLKGYKVGRFCNIFFNHYGHALSTTFPERTGITQISDEV